MSPSIANEAVVPPVVGSVHREIYGIDFSESSASLELVLANCINEKAPSIILAPPDFEIINRGIRRSIDLLIAKTIFSPTTEPTDPPIKVKSIHAIIICLPIDFPIAVLIASL